MPPVHFPFLRWAAILSRIRSPMISRSNWANESRTFSVSRRRLFGHSKRLVSRERTTGLIGFSRFGKTFGPSLANWHQRALQNALLGSQLPPVVNSAQLWALWNTG